VLDAQVEAEGLYASFGFRRVGEEFVEDGIRHVSMRRNGR
jgi:ElaA protein